MKLLVDMNLSPSWVPVLERHGYLALHWSAVGDPRASDPVILGWAHENGYVVVTNDLGFGAILAAARAAAPSVIQVRTQDVTPDHLEGLVVAALEQYADLLEQGVLISIDDARSRARILPLVR